MNPSDSENRTYDAAFSFDIRNLSEGKHSAFLYLPQAFHSHIGLVIAHWGNFEVTFDHCLAALIEAEAVAVGARDPKHWKFSSFKKRRKLFRDICNEWLAKKKPVAATRLLEILDSTPHLHRQRNMIAHGNYSYTIPPLSSEAKDCYAYNGDKQEKMRFDEAILRTLHHDISHLTADLVIGFRLIGKIEGMPFVLISDVELLRIYRDTIHPWNPDPAKRPNADILRTSPPDYDAESQSSVGSQRAPPPQGLA